MEKVKKFLINFSKVGGTFVVYFGLSILLGYLYEEIFNSTNYFIRNISLIGGNLILLLVLILCYLPTIVNNLKNLKRKDLKLAYKYWGLGLLIMYLSNIIIVSLNKSLASNEALNRSIIETDFLYAFVVMCFIAPLIEEIVFRLSLKKLFTHKWFYCLTSAFLFGALHLTSANSLTQLLYIIPYGALGFFFAKAVYETDNICSSIVVHITHNTLAVIIIIISKLTGV